MGESSAERISELAGRASLERSDSRDTHARLIEAVNEWVSVHGSPPARLAEIAATAGVSTATAYRHFSSIDDVIQAFVLQLPVRAVELFESTDDGTADAVEQFACWNRSWVASCVEHGPLAIHLRSPRGFLERRDSGDAVISYACAQIEPLLDALPGDTVLQLFIWNVTSDPREVLDLLGIGWTQERIAAFVTDTVLATPTS